MNRRNFLSALLKTTAGIVATPLLKYLPQSPPLLMDPSFVIADGMMKLIEISIYRPRTWIMHPDCYHSVVELIDND